MRRLCNRVKNTKYFLLQPTGVLLYVTFPLVRAFFFGGGLRAAVFIFCSCVPTSVSWLGPLSNTLVSVLA
jgi:hypothetical protein